MDAFSFLKKDDELGSVFQNLDKGAVLQEKRVFHESPLNVRKCRLALSQILYVLNQGETFTKTEATDLFFAVTKLYQSQDIYLRLLMYLMIRELTSLTSDSIIVISSLTRDMTSKNDLYKSNAMRVLWRILDNTMLPQFERYFKQSIVYTDPSIASAALVSSVHLIRTCPDVVKRWSNEVSEALQSRNLMVQYHAFGLLYYIKQHDKLAVAKLIAGTFSLIQASKSPYAHCLLIRLAKKILEEGIEKSAEAPLFEYIAHSLRNNSDMVVLEAARALCDLPQATPKDVAPAVSDLQLFLNTAKPALRFAAVRTLNKLANKYPILTSLANLDLEALLSDPNRNTATLAISCLLKITGSEQSVDKLMKQISGFITDIPDEFKIQVIEAIRTLCLKYPSRHRSLMTFLSNMLREEGGFEYKQVVVETFFTIISSIPDALEFGLTQLCEFIEDCEYAYLSTRILYLLSQEGPKTATAGKFIRYIYNRTTLETAPVRAAAVSALARFGVKLPSLQSQVLILLKRCMSDSDDEVRDRAAYAVRVFESGDSTCINNFVLPSSPPLLSNLNLALQQYLEGGAETPFDISAVPQQYTAPPSKQNQPQSQSQSPTPTPAPAQTPGPNGPAILSMPEFALIAKSYFKSCAPVHLTEKETEYVVSCVKHIFTQDIVLQFDVLNTMKSEQLENVHVELIPAEGSESFTISKIIPAAQIPFDTTVSCYVLIKAPKGASPGSFGTTLKFIVKEVDSSGEVEETGSEEEYPLETLEIAVGDFITPLTTFNVQTDWEALQQEAVETYNLSTVKTLQDAVNELMSFLSMNADTKYAKVEERAKKHILFMSGTFMGGITAIVRARMRIDPSGTGVNLELTARSSVQEISQLIASSV
ncbi:coatomer subunit gamma [Pelomyxa schiedti]|nr:coatomer subunit gamma [Pelomyxa schiedti]